MIKDIKKRIEIDMGYPLSLVSTFERLDWIKKRFNPMETIYMGDGIFDHYVFKEVGYSVAPSNGDEYVKSVADFVTKRSGANRAVAEASLHILEKFFKPYNPNELPDKPLRQHT